MPNIARVYYIEILQLIANRNAITLVYYLGCTLHYYKLPPCITRSILQQLILCITYTHFIIYNFLKNSIKLIDFVCIAHTEKDIDTII